MQCNEDNRLPAGAHSLKLDGRERLNVSGVEDVTGFDENLVILSTSLGDLNVRGQGLHIDKIDLDAGVLELQGKIQELSYEDSVKGSNIWKRLFG